MWCGDGIEVDWRDSLEELSLTQDTDDITSHKAAQAISSDREPRNLFPILLEFLHLAQYLEDP